MKSIHGAIAAALVATGLAAGAIYAQAQTPTKANAAAQESALRKNLEQRLPNIGKIDEVRAAPIAGLYEVRVGTELFYSDAEGNYLVNGQIIDTRSKRNGAARDRQGRFELADGGTIFLDEVGEVPPAVQVKLLRVLQDKEVERVGEGRPRRVDVRVVAATNRDLEAAMREGTFREDLYYRLNGVRLRLPPLRERPADVLLLVEHFAARAARGTPPPPFAPETLRALRAHRWPGNIRELENVVERAVLLAGPGPVEVRHLPEELREVGSTPDEGILTLEEVERRHIVRVLAEAKDYEEAARALGIDPATLWRKRKRYGLG